MNLGKFKLELTRFFPRDEDSLVLELFEETNLSLLTIFCPSAWQIDQPETPTKRWEAKATPWSTTFATYTPFEVLKYHHSILPQIIKPVSSESRLKAEMSISGETISLVFSRLLIICLTPNHFFRGCQPLKRQVFDVWLTDKNGRSVHVKNDLTLKESRAHKQLGPKNAKNWELSFKLIRNSSGWNCQL